MNLEVHAKELDEAVGEWNPERWFRAVAEEAGETIGAFNKLERGGTSIKQRTPEDVLGEAAQLVGDLFVAMMKLGFPPDAVLQAADEFMVSKAAEIRNHYA